MSYNRFLRIPPDPQHCGPIPENCDKNIRLATGEVNVLYVKRDRLRPLPRVTLDIFVLEPAGPKFITTVTLDEGMYEFEFFVGGGIFFAHIKPDCNYTAPVNVASGSVLPPDDFDFEGEISCLKGALQVRVLAKVQLAELGQKLSQAAAVGSAGSFGMWLSGGDSCFAISPGNGFATYEGGFQFPGHSCPSGTIYQEGNFTFGGGIC